MVPASAFRKRWFFTLAGQSSEFTCGSSSLRRQPYSVSIPTTRSMEADYASNGDLAKSKKFPLTFILSPNGERRMPRFHGSAGASPSVPRGSRDTPSCFSATVAEKSGPGAGLPNKAQRAKHTSDPIFLAPGTLLSAALLSGSSPTLPRLHCSSRHPSASPPENQRDHE